MITDLTFSPLLPRFWTVLRENRTDLGLAYHLLDLLYLRHEAIN
jgi:hypothetical protein